jgi:NAD-dependent deacetylase
MKKIVVFTGAGISKESGIETFRDHNGLWESHKIEDVASYVGWKKNRELVLDFYNKRRNQLKSVEPNDAHLITKELELYFDVTVVTQNVDDLHERAQSSNIIHLHGQLKKSRSTVDNKLVYDCENDIKIGDRCEKNSQLRPHIVWFGENLFEEDLNNAIKAFKSADIIIIVGTSMVVQPANKLHLHTKDNCDIYYVDPCDISFEKYDKEIKHIKEVATKGMCIIKDILLNEHTT